MHYEARSCFGLANPRQNDNLNHIASLVRQTGKVDLPILYHSSHHVAPTLPLSSFVMLPLCHPTPQQATRMFQVAFSVRHALHALSISSRGSSPYSNYLIVWQSFISSPTGRVMARSPDRYAKPAARRSISALSVSSQGASMSSRPKCPYAAVAL